MVIRSGTPAGGVASSRIAIDIRVTASATGDIVIRGRIPGEDIGAGCSDGDIVMRIGRAPRFVDRGGIRIEPTSTTSTTDSTASDIGEIKPA